MRNRLIPALTLVLVTLFGALALSAGTASAKPVTGDVKVAISAECGSVTFTFTNTTKYLFAATYNTGDGRPSGDLVLDRRETIKGPDGPVPNPAYNAATTLTKTFTYPEDSGTPKALLGVYQGAEQENYPPTVEQVVKTDCKPNPPTEHKVIKITYVHDCTSDTKASAKLVLKIRSARTMTISYSTTDGQEGTLEAGGDPFKYVGQTKVLEFAEDAGDGEVVITFGTAKATVVTDCASPPSTTPPTTPSTTPSVPSSSVPPSSTSSNPGVHYANCDAVRAADKDPLYRGSPGFRQELDFDGDGTACEVDQVSNLGGKGDSGLAYTGTSGLTPLLVGGGLLVVGLALLLVLRFRRNRSIS